MLHYLSSCLYIVNLEDQFGQSCAFLVPILSLSAKNERLRVVSSFCMFFIGLHRVSTGGVQICFVLIFSPQLITYSHNQL